MQILNSLRLMQLRFYDTAFVAQRLSSVVFKGYRFGAMANKGIVSRPANNFTNNEQGKAHSWNDNDFPTIKDSLSSKPIGNKRTGVDSDTPSPQKLKEVQNIDQMQVEASASKSHHNNTYSVKNHTPPPPIGPKLLETNRERGEFSRGLKFEKTRVDSKGVENSDSVQDLASASTNQQYDTELPRNFGKKRTPRDFKYDKPRDTYHGHGESKIGSNIDEPFDICFPEFKTKAYSAEENGQVLRPGMVLFKHYIPISEQVDIINRCRELGCGPGGFYRPGYEGGAKLRLYMMCLGQDWNPQTSKYGKTRQHDNVTPPDIPYEFSALVSRVINDSHTVIKRDDAEIVNPEDVLPAMSPDVCIVNYYTTTGRLGLHQDRDESRESLRKGLPVVSISIGDSAEFLYSDYRDVDEAESVLLESGDVLVFGGESRHVFHGVKTIIRNTAPRDLRKQTALKPGRLNLTFRKY